MNINDSTKVNLPKKEGNLPENNKPSFKLTKPSENKKGLSKSAKYVIGFAGGIAAGAAGAGIAYAVVPPGEDEPAQDVNAQQDDKLAENNAESKVQEVHVHETHVEQAAPEKAAEPAKADDGHHAHADVKPTTEPAVDLDEDEITLTDEDDLIEEDYYYVEDMKVTDLDGDGNYEISAIISINGQNRLVVDADLDGTFDWLIADFNEDESISPEEIVDISDAGVTVDDVFSELAESDPDKAIDFIESMTVFYEDGEENPYIDVIDESDYIESDILDDYDEDVIVTEDGIEISGDTDESDSLVSVDPNDDHMLAVVPEEEGTDSINDGVNDDHQWTSNEDDGGYVSPTEFPESVDC